MLYLDWDEFWWKNITGALSVVSRVASSLLEGHMVLLNVPSDIPWRHAMRSTVQSVFLDQTESREIFFREIDLLDDDLGDEDPGTFILQKFCANDSRVRNGYREKSGESIQSYIKTRNIIQNQIIWIKGISGNAVDRWLKFCKGFSPRCATDGLFVLEVHEMPNISLSKNIACIDFAGCVSQYDVQLFNNFVLGTRTEYSDPWKNYISTAASALCKVDAEVSLELLTQVDFRSESPLEGLQRIAEDREFDRRGAEDDSDHILRHIRDRNQGELEHRLWNAQIQVLFPLIEMERVAFIRKWQPQIQTALDSYPEDVNQYGDVVTRPEDVELGTLDHLINAYDAASDQSKLAISDTADRQRIHFLRNCRNTLAHVSYLTPEQVAQLLNPESQISG